MNVFDVRKLIAKFRVPVSFATQGSGTGASSLFLRLVQFYVDNGIDRTDAEKFARSVVSEIGRRYIANDGEIWNPDIQFSVPLKWGIVVTIPRTGTTEEEQKNGILTHPVPAAEEYSIQAILNVLSRFPLVPAAQKKYEESKVFFAGTKRETTSSVDISTTGKTTEKATPTGLTPSARVSGLVDTESGGNTTSTSSETFTPSDLDSLSATSAAFDNQSPLSKLLDLVENVLDFMEV